MAVLSVPQDFVAVLIFAYCGHRRYVASPAPMDAEQRSIEKCRPCPECAALRTQP